MKNTSLVGYLPLRLLLFLCCFATAAALQAQAKLSIQGIIKKSDGTALPDGDYSIKFRIYNVETGGVALYTETQTDLEVTGGVYSAILGSVTPLNIPFTEPYWVSVSVGSGQEMVPRIPLTSAPYALSLIGQDNIFPSSGQVGVGAQVPTEKLHVKNTAPINGTAKILIEGPENGTAELNIKKSGSPLLGSLGYNAGSDVFRLLHAGGGLQLQASGTGNSIFLTPNTTGLVNIEGSLLVNQNVVARGGAPGASGANRNGFAFADNGGDNDSGLFSTADAVVSLYSNNAERLKVQGDKVTAFGGFYAEGGIPGAGGVNSNGYAFNDVTNGNASGLFATEDGTYGTAVNLYINDDSKLWVTESDVYLDITSTFSGAQAQSLSIRPDGQVVRFTSSARYKQDIRPLVTDFTRILQLSPKRYAYKSFPDEPVIGFVAEEADALGLKDFVGYDQQGRPDALRYDQMVVYLIPLMKEQQQRLATLEAEKTQTAAALTALQAENAALRQALNDLRADVNALKASANR